MRPLKLDHIRYGLNIFAKYGYEITNCSDDILEVSNLWNGPEMNANDLVKVCNKGWEWDNKNKYTYQI